jgi:hypothetical protein
MTSPPGCELQAKAESKKTATSPELARAPKEFFKDVLQLLTTNTNEI